MRFFGRRREQTCAFDREALAEGIYGSIRELENQRTRLLSSSESEPEQIVGQKRKAAAAIAVRISELERCRHYLSVALAPRNERVGAELQTAITETNGVIASLVARLGVNPSLADSELKEEIVKLFALVDRCING